MVVYYYDVATIWIRPVDLKVTVTVTATAMFFGCFFGSVLCGGW